MVTAATQKEWRSLWGRGDGEDHRSESKLGEKKKSGELLLEENSSASLGNMLELEKRTMV